MDRQTVYPGQVPLETDLLNTNRNVLIALGMLAQATLGTSTLVDGLACTPGSGLTVSVGPGQIFTQAAVDATGYSSLAAMANPIVKQGVLLNATTLSCPAPATAGQSINYLVEAQFQEVDTNPVVLPYYNASNPTQAWSGPTGSGTSQNTTRADVCAVQIKAGIAATTGTQTTPSADAGWTGLYVVTVAYGALSISGGNISTLSGAPFIATKLPGTVSKAQVQSNGICYAVDTGAANAYAATYSPTVTTLTDGMVLEFKAANANTAAATFSPNGLTANTIVGGAHAALQGGEIVAGGMVELMWHATLNSWVLLGCTGGALQVGTATQSQHAVTLAQAQSMGTTALQQYFFGQF